MPGTRQPRKGNTQMAEVKADAGTIEWRDPAPSRRGFGSGTAGVWIERLKPLTAHAGRWAVIYKAEDGKTSKASGMAASLRGEKTRKPAGKWEFTSRGCEVYARYIGPE